jgi:hypothetical protein
LHSLRILSEQKQELFMIRSTLFLTNTLSWMFIVLVHWKNYPRIDMLLHSDTLFWFRANQCHVTMLVPPIKFTFVLFHSAIVSPVLWFIVLITSLVSSNFLAFLSWDIQARRWAQLIHIEMPTDMTNILQVKTRSIWTIYVVICDSYPFFFKQYLCQSAFQDKRIGSSQVL